MTTVQRSVSAASPMGTPRGLPNLPLIEHPMSKLGDKTDLSVRGSSTHARIGGLRRSPTDAEFRTGAPAGPDRILNWPPGKIVLMICLIYTFMHSKYIYSKWFCILFSIT